MSLRALKKELNKMEKSEILKVVSELYKKVPEAKVYLDIYATGDIEPIIEKYKNEIEKYVYPSGRKLILREKEARKLIRKMRKMKIAELSIALELHYVDCCLDIIGDFGLYDDGYYNALINMFYEATDKVLEIDKADEYEDYINNLIAKADYNGILLTFYT